ncbi:MAG: 4Fe-4S single cluster domain-containing protein [Planctomycetaceae bacterium]
MTLPAQIQIAQILPCTEAEGPGRRFAIWVQGCPLRCVECCNPEMLSFDGGTSVVVDDLIDQILQSRSLGIEGVTLIGGEPFAHAAALSRVAAVARDAGLSVMVFSGYTLAELKDMADPNVHEFLSHIDLLVDGPYDRTSPDSKRRWIGSTNQRVHFLTNRYSAEDSFWNSANTLEVRWDGRELIVNGFPARSAAGLWKRGRNKESLP